MTELTLSINGDEAVVDVDPARTLVKVLRDDLGLTGTKHGCSTGVCGACTVQIDGEARKSCMHLVAMVADSEIRTIEGLSDDGELHPIQEAFVEEFSLQCGFCTPGFIMSTSALLAENPRPSEAEIEEAIHGNICRCTGYRSIIKGVKRSSDLMTEADPAAE